MSEYSDIIHPTRIEILKSITGTPKSLKDIADELQISRPEISRHLNKLRSLELVRKEDSLNVVTELGTLILKILGPLDLVLQHYDYFSEHPLINFPQEFLYGLNHLRSGKIILGSGNVFQKEIEYAKIASDEMKLMINTPMPNVTGVKFKHGEIIVPDSANSPILNHENLSKDMSEYEVRKFPEINYSIFILGDKAAFINFPNKKGLPDLNSCLFVTKQEGISFIMSLWEFYWNKSR